MFKDEPSGEPRFETDEIIFLSPGIAIGSGSDPLCVYLSGTKVIELRFPTPNQAAKFQGIREGLSYGDLEEILRLDAQPMIEELMAGKFLSRTSTAGLNSPLDYFWSGMVENPLSLREKFRNTRVFVLGIGSIGQFLVQHLAAHGIGQIDFADFDTVSHNNLTRQFLLTPEDVGELKVKSILPRLERQFPQTKFRSFELKVTKKADLRKLLSLPEMRPTAIVNCADTPPVYIELWCAQIALELGSTMLSSQVGHNQAFLGPLLSDSAEFKRYILHLKERLKTLPIRWIPPISAEPISNAITAAMTARKLLEFLAMPALGTKSEKIKLDLSSFNHSHLWS